MHVYLEWFMVSNKRVRISPLVKGDVSEKIS